MPDTTQNSNEANYRSCNAFIRSGHARRPNAGNKNRRTTESDGNLILRDPRRC
jgi:hypothetical protein